MGIGVLVLEAGLDKLFNCLALWEIFEVVIAFSSLGDPSKNQKNKQTRTYHCNYFTNDQLWLAVPCNGEVEPSLGNQVPDTMLLILRNTIPKRN